MEKITLKLHEFYALDFELNGLVNPETRAKVSKGLLNEKLSLITKYWLSGLSKTVAAEKAAIEELKNELIKKYGTELPDGNINIPISITEKDEEGNEKQVINPKYQEFDKEFGALLQTEKEIEYKPISLKELSELKTDEYYPVIFKLVKED
jgi:hypothetical protein